MNHALALFIAVPLLGAGLSLPLAKINRRLPSWLALLVSFYLMLTALLLYFTQSPEAVDVYKIGGWATPLGINLVMDGLSHLLLLVVGLVAGLISVYSMAYIEHYTGQDKYFTLLQLMLVGMTGVVLSGDLFTLFVFLEIAAVATYILVAFGTEAEELEAAFRYLIIGSVASLFILLGISLVFSATGNLNLAEIAKVFPRDVSPLKKFITVLFLAGFGMKAALVPFHSWLPDAHTAAPAPISAMLSGVLIKILGIYCLVRVFYNVLGIDPQLLYALSLLGLISILAGGLLALFQWDFKRLLAYSSISQVGYIMLGIGLGTPLGIGAGIFHLFNHALFKPLLFLNAGAIEASTGTRQLKEMGGLSKKMPVTFVTSLFGSLSIAGLPPFNGFWSKLFIVLACVQAGRFWSALIAVLGSILTLACFLKFLRYAFFEKLPTNLEKVKEAPGLMIAVTTILALLCLLVGIFSPYLSAWLLNPAMLAVKNGLGYSTLGALKP